MDRREFMNMGFGAVLAGLGRDQTGWIEHPQIATATEKTASALPWESEMSLQQAALKTVFTDRLDSGHPTQIVGIARLALSNAQMRSSLWGPSDRVTLSLLKSDVWDRRYGLAPVVTLAEVRAGAFSPANRGMDDMPPNRRRPVRGYLPANGTGRVDPCKCWNAYPFPCQKPVGQIIFGMDELAGVTGPELKQSCADGVVRCELKNDHARTELEILLSMTRNVHAIRGRMEGVAAPWLRLYRHEDQAWRRYMTADKKGFIPFAQTSNDAPYDYAKDAVWNGPIEPPQSGTDGHYFWIHQRFPAEKTFPEGFHYVLMGVVAGAGKAKIETADGKQGLGTPSGLRADSEEPYQAVREEGYKAIREAPGSAATAWLAPVSNGTVTAYVTVVTCNDAADPMAEARRQLEEAAVAGFDALVAENNRWYRELYDRREDGRIFSGTPTSTAESVREAFTSWHIRHGAANKPDMRRYESTASYTAFEQDWQLWHSLPCYNEIFYTSAMVRNRADSADMWWKLIEHWRDAARANAKQIYGVAEGMALVHGYLPPVKADRYVHTSVALEYCIETIAQMVKVLWEEWDYGGDESFLRQKTYPALRDTAMFYANYARKGEDGYYHFIPSLEAEAWGIFPEFKRATDCISALCMARWTFRRAAETSQFLGVDADRRKQWREIEECLAPYPIYETQSGPIFNTVADTTPSWKRGDHPWFVALYPTLLADEINLDSSEELRAKMIRTATAVPSPRSPETLMLLGASGQERGHEFAEALLNSRSGRIHLFPDIPADAVLAFRRLQTRGAFLVSAVKDKQSVSYLEVEARRNVECQLMNPWPGKRILIRDGSHQTPYNLDKENGECAIFQAKAGHKYVISSM